MQDYAAFISRPLNLSSRPVIGITANYGEKGAELAEAYSKSVELSGGIPLVIPAGTTEPEALCALLERIDGLLLSGGADLNPLLLGQEPVPRLGGVNPKRDRSELLLTRLAYDRQLPILGICRGIQVMAAALGGSVHQDLQTSFPDASLIKHSQDAPRNEKTHYVDIEAGTVLEKLLGERIAVNSFHHQAVNDAGPHFVVAARSSDGVVEAIESSENKPLLGVQWHPESFFADVPNTMQPLFEYLVEQADLHRKAREFHTDLSVITLDSHCDTPMFFEQGVNFDQRDEKVLVDLHKMTEGHLDSVIMAAYIPQGERSETGLQAATAKATQILTDIRQMVDRCEGVAMAFTPDDLAENKREGLKSVMPAIENGYAIGREIENVERFRQMGVVYMTLCHNGDNDICDSARKSNAEHGGLSDFGREVVHEMNRTGMMIDLSHAAESTFYDVVSLSEVPVVCSHSSSMSCCQHPRNLTDDQLRTLAENGGVAQVTLYNYFLVENGTATIDDALRHLLHMIDVAGIDHVGFGSDFDGDGGIVGLAAANEVMNLTKRLIAEGLTRADLEKIWGGNFLRVMRMAQEYNY